jgi:superfamily II DNA or RNA helicase
MIKPRRYQERAKEQFLDWVEKPSENLATIILPTGTGKTKTAKWCLEEHIGNHRDTRVLWAAHREELINQAYNDLNDIPNVNIEIEMADKRASADANIVVGSVQTLHRKRKNLKDFTPNVIVVDEWHHYSEKNKTYHGLLERFPKAKILGLTATPYRFAGGDLPTGRKLIEMDIGTAVRHNYLVPPNPTVIKTNVSLAGVHTQAGDFKLDELSKAVNVDARNKLIADRIIKAVKEEGRQGILYAVDVAHSKAMCKLLAKELRVGEVYGETDKDERRDFIKRINDREIDVICNNLVLTEGFDAPHLSFVCIARPTKSLGLYTQCLGRGLRLFDGKEDCLVIDVFDKVKVTQGRVTYSIVASTGDIDGSNKRSEAIIKEDIADRLENFPVVMALKDGERWTVDNDTWFASSWILADNQWVITWSKRDNRIPTDEFDYFPFKFPPTKRSLQLKPINVKHNVFGDGVAHDITGGMFANIVVDFGAKHGIKEVPLSTLHKQEVRYKKEKLSKPIQRAFYICMKPDKSLGRLISLEQQGNTFSVVDDMKADATTLDEMVKVAATQDDMAQIVRSDAKWRQRPMSDKQRKVLENFMTWGKIPDDLDLDDMTGGDASVIMDQVNWHGIINNLFGGKSHEDLIGYDALWEDV